MNEQELAAIEARCRIAVSETLDEYDPIDVQEAHTTLAGDDVPALVAEVRRLRATLTGIADMTWPPGHAVTAAHDMQANARAALGRSEHEQETG